MENLNKWTNRLIIADIFLVTTMILAWNVVPLSLLTIDTIVLLAGIYTIINNKLIHTRYEK